VIESESEAYIMSIKASRLDEDVECWRHWCSEQSCASLIYVPQSHKMIKVETTAPMRQMEPAVAYIGSTEVGASHVLIPIERKYQALD